MRTLAYILAGGFATRLYPLTLNYPKPLINICDRPIIDYILDKVIEITNNVVILINRRFENMFKRWSEKWKDINLNFIVEASMRNEEKLGAIKAVAEALKIYKAENYIIIASDNFFTDSLKGMYKLYLNVKKPVVAIYEVDSPEKVRETSCVEINDEGRIVYFEEKPKRPKSKLIATCIYMMPHKTLVKIYEYLRNNVNPDNPGYFLRWLIINGEEVYSYKLKGYWIDIGTLETLNEALIKCREVLKPRPGFEPGTCR